MRAQKDSRKCFSSCIFLLCLKTEGFGLLSFSLSVILVSVCSIPKSTVLLYTSLLVFFCCISLTFQILCSRTAKGPLKMNTFIMGIHYEVDFFPAKAYTAIELLIVRCHSILCCVYLFQFTIPIYPLLLMFLPFHLSL